MANSAGIFPEGGITRDGTLQEFKGGIMKILERPARRTERAGDAHGADQSVGLVLQPRGARRAPWCKPFRRGLFSRVGLNVGAPVSPLDVQPELLRTRVQQLLAV
jgi:1-acyl-sn-glycerol-3-phosphate acyltransferase